MCSGAENGNDKGIYSGVWKVVFEDGTESDIIAAGAPKKEEKKGKKEEGEEEKSETKFD